MISARGLTRIYKLGDSEVIGINRVDLEIAAGALVVLKGNSGSGKSTLLSLLAGLDRPSRGDLTVANHDLNKTSDGELTHFDSDGRPRMVDVGGKDVTQRRAVAEGALVMAPETLARIQKGETPKGDPLQVGELAGIMAGKRTADLIPLCHQLPGASIALPAKWVTTPAKALKEAALFRHRIEKVGETALVGFGVDLFTRSLRWVRQLGLVRVKPQERTRAGGV